jgi:SAM-dependent methyltransferase
MEKTKTLNLRTRPEPHNTQFVEAMATYHFVKDLVKGLRVLDAGCGFGYGTEHLAGYANEVTGVDFSPSTIEWAKKRYRKNNINFITADITHLGFPDEYFDAVCCFETIHGIKEHERVLDELRRVLKRRGLFFISTRRKITESGGFDPEHIRKFTSGELGRLLSASGFGMADIYALTRPKEVYKIEARLKVMRIFDPFNLRRFLPRRLISFLVYFISRAAKIKPPQEMLYENFYISKDDGKSDSPGILAICKKAG